MDGLLILCLALLLVAVGLKFKTIIDLRRATREHTEVITERQRLHDARTQSQMVLDRAEVLERELTNDVRDLGPRPGRGQETRSAESQAR
ncbi:MAG: hypothetical protein QF689_14830 [Candidatus Latescibacteria bacterium]|nr:hypothetical protein [Candidatus Latescibacterota bacterium]